MLKGDVYSRHASRWRVAGWAQRGSGGHRGGAEGTEGERSAQRGSGADVGIGWVSVACRGSLYPLQSLKGSLCMRSRLIKVRPLSPHDGRGNAGQGGSSLALRDLPPCPAFPLPSCGGFWTGTEGERWAQRGSGGHRGGAVGTEGERWA